MPCTGSWIMPKTLLDKSLRLIVFDYDGTLVDSQHMIVDSMSRAFLALDLPPPDAEAVRQVVGLRLEEAIARIADDDCQSKLVADLAEHYRQAFWALRQDGAFHEPLFPGVRETLERLRRPEILLAIATGKNRRGLLHSLAHHGISDHFFTLRTADDGPGKPHPAILKQAMAESGVDAAETVLLGDTSFDMEMAQNAGVRAIGAGWGYHSNEVLLAAGASCVIDSIAALENVLDSSPEGRS
jgi:phosphoglycolate phosphatase